MMRLTKKHLITALIVLSTIFISSFGLADEYTIKEKLQQCEATFDKMHSGKLSQEEAWKMRRQHKKLVKEILSSLNERNHAAMKPGADKLSEDEVLDNFIVMGSLLEMLSTENLRMTDEWGYPLNE